MDLKTMIKEDRPRERLLREGASSLSNQELLAIILKTGSKNKNVLELSNILLTNIGSIDNFKDLTINKLIEFKGIGLVKAISIMATIELGKRIYFSKEEPFIKYTSAEDIYLNLKYLFVGKKQEMFYALYFNNKQELIEKKLLFMGTFNRSVVHPREIFKTAYLCSATSIICIHNHPSGDVNPSKEDIYFTNSLVKLGKMNAILIIDHIIIGDTNYYSFFDNGKITNL